MEKHKLIIDRNGKKSSYVCNCLEDAVNMVLILKNTLRRGTGYEIKKI